MVNGHFEHFANQVEKGHLQAGPQRIVVHESCRALADDASHRFVADPGPGIVDDRFAPAHVAGIGFDPTQLEYGPVVDLARGDLLLPPGKGYIDYDPIHIDDFHRFLLGCKKGLLASSSREKHRSIALTSPGRSRLQV